MLLMMLDGNSIVNRAYYGVRMLNAPDGTPTNAIYGFLQILHRVWDEQKPDGLCVAFDRKEPTFRHTMYDGYKGTRKAMPEELAVQLPLLKEVLDDMGIWRVELAGWEADDLLGTMSLRSTQAGYDSVLVTGDKDSFQLITDHCQVLHIKTARGNTESIVYTPARFEGEYGFAPIRIVDLKALMGDTSDNIPGVPGVGEKTAMDLLHRFGSLEKIYEDPTALDIKPAVLKKLQAGADSAKMSYALATIHTDAPIDFDPQAIRWSFDSVKPELYNRFLKLGFSKYIERYKLVPPESKVQADAAVQETSPDSIPVQPICTLEAVQEAVQAHEASGSPVAIATDPDDRYVALYSLNNNIATLIDLDAPTLISERKQAMEAVLGAAFPKIAHNLKDALRRWKSQQIDCAGNWQFDTALAAYLLDATAGSYDLSRLCVQYLGYELMPATAGQMSLLDQEQTQDQTRLLREAQAMAQLYPVLEEKLQAQQMLPLYQDVELPLCEVLADMEREGFLVDWDAIERFGQDLDIEIARVQQRVYDQAGESFNINSPKQLGAILFDKLLLPSGKKTKTGWSTSADILEKLRDKHPIIPDILDYRMLTKLKSTYVDGLQKLRTPDGRLHTSFQMTVTATGRLSSTEPNLQNIPIRKPMGARLREMFIAAPGKVLVDADYSQIELRLLAHISQDANMIAAFQSGEDIHRVTASQVFGVPVEQVTATQRSHAKAVNFGIVYGISAWSLSQDISVSKWQAQRYMDAYLNKYSGVKRYQEEIVAKAKADGYVETLDHRRRALPELKSSNYATRSFGERVALNMPIQGTAADVIKKAMVQVAHRLRREGLEAKLILQVHDELIVECPAHEAAQVERLLTEEMEHVGNYAVPLIAVAHTGHNWADAH